jgi:formate hydrogenlyase subunit 3/multisubunit Na+/H+ antiporter MnhD subunit
LLIASVLTLLVVARVWSALWPSAPPRERAPVLSTRVLPVAALVALIVVGGLAAEQLFVVSGKAATQLLDRGQYFQAVLGVPP